MVNRHSTFPKGILIIYCLLVLTTCGCKSGGGGWIFGGTCNGYNG